MHFAQMDCNGIDEQTSDFDRAAQGLENRTQPGYD